MTISVLTLGPRRGFQDCIMRLPIPFHITIPISRDVSSRVRISISGWSFRLRGQIVKSQVWFGGWGQVSQGKDPRAKIYFLPAKQDPLLQNFFGQAVIF